MQELFTNKRNYDRQGFVLERQWRKKEKKPLDSAILLKEIDTSRRIFLPSCRRWHQVQVPNPLELTKAVHIQLHLPIAVRQARKHFFTALVILHIEPPTIGEVTHCCTCIGSSRTSALALRLYTPDCLIVCLIVCLFVYLFVCLFVCFVCLCFSFMQPPTQS